MKLIATSIICAAIVSTGVGFAFGQASDPPAASAASGSGDARALKQIAGQLRTLNRTTTASRRTLDELTDFLESDTLLRDGSQGLLGYLKQSGILEYNGRGAALYLRDICTFERDSAGKFTGC